MTELAALTRFAIDHLERHGYTVTLGQAFRDFEPVKQFRESLPVKMNGSTLFQRFASAKCPDFDCMRGPSGRIVKVRPNPALVAFCSQPVARNGRLRVTTHIEHDDWR